MPPLKYRRLVTAGIGAVMLQCFAATSHGQQVDIALSPIGNAGNAADTTGYGAVSYDYDIGTYDVTISQYCTFLNDVATYSDPYDVYNSNMTDMGNFSSITGIAGITRSGTAGDYSYSVVGSSASDPVTMVTWLDAARFSNWLDNGQPVITGSAGETAKTTEQGAYTLNGDIDASGTTGLETTNSNATWWLPSENEWYKAAYYDPVLNSGSGGYWAFATQSNTAPGNVVGSGSNQANYVNSSDDYSVTQASYSSSQNYLTPVGAFTGSKSYYGTYDQTGDVFEWNDAVISNDRGDRGGGWNVISSEIGSSYRGGGATVTTENSQYGFRVASVYTAVPEPGATMLALAGLGAAVVAGRMPVRKRG